jgi:digeranylgeranylglycerophospholipid reductase
LYDTIIIGAGPVGSYLAEKLAQLSYKVLVLDKKAAAGQDICCTGIVGKECLDLLAIDDSLIFRQARAARFVVPSGKSLRLQRDGEVAYVLDRPALELALASRAQAAGAVYLLSALVTDIQNGVDGIHVEADCGGQRRMFEAETAVIATGFGSPLPSKLGLGKINYFIMGVQAEVEVNGIDEVEVYFDHALAPGGFAWLVPTKKNKGLAGLMTYQQPKNCLNKFLSDLKAQKKIASNQVIPSYGAIPLRSLHRTYTDRILVVGEAAGQVKPTTGGGIFFSLLCADVATDTLHQALQTKDFSQSKLASYQKQWRAKLGKELKTGYWARGLYEKLGNQQIELLYYIASNNGIPQLITELEDFSFDWHSKIILKVLMHLALSIPGQAIKSLAKRS